jgi:serine protease Do
MRGEVVGILISSLDQGSACFSLPIEAAEKIRCDFIRHGELRPGWLGVEVSPARAPAAGSVAEISMLNVGAPGQKAGLQIGDVIVGIGDRDIRGPEDVLDAAYFIAAEDDVSLRVVRAGENVQIKVTASDRPETNVRTAGDIPLVVPAGESDLRGLPVSLDR